MTHNKTAPTNSNTLKYFEKTALIALLLSALVTVFAMLFFVPVEHTSYGGFAGKTTSIEFDVFNPDLFTAEGIRKEYSTKDACCDQFTGSRSKASLELYIAEGIIVFITTTLLVFFISGVIKINKS